MVSIAVLLAVVSFSYAYIKYDTEEQGINVLGTDCISISMTDVTSSITLQKAFPMTEENGEKTDPYTFTLTNNCSVGVDYQINLRIEDDGIAPEQKMPVENNIATKVDEKPKVILSSENKVTKTETQTEDKYTIGNGTLDPKGTVQHSVRIWLDETAGNETQNKIFKSKVVVEATQNQIVDKNYTEPLLHGADPVLESTKTSGPVAMLTANEIAVEPTTTDKLIPVKIEATKEGTGTTVTVADLTEEWYKYEEKRWANAVVLKDDNNVETLDPGTELNEDDIESYFVWIPKYKYKLFNLEEYSSQTGTKQDKHNQAIEIVFGLDNTTDSDEKQECKTPEAATASGNKGTCQVGDYMTHPAFLAFGGNGLWVGKFETGHNSGSVSSAITEYSDDLQNELIIKPNQYSWTNTIISTMHQLAYNYHRDLDSHMMKNTEWGAVAYLTQSIYGRCTKSEDGSTTCEEVMINNNSNKITGYAATEAPTSTSSNAEAAEPGNDGSSKTINYNNHSSVKASTTGNYTGVYDMSGGSTEIVMGVMYGPNNDRPATGQTTSIYANSGFNGPYTSTVESSPGYGKSKDDGIDFPNAEYYDVYEFGRDYESPETMKKRILGDATGEMGPFNSTAPVTGSYYDDGGRTVYATAPWFMRGRNSSSGTYAGIFAFESEYVSYQGYVGFRLVLAPL